MHPPPPNIHMHTPMHTCLHARTHMHTHTHTHTVSLDMIQATHIWSKMFKHVLFRSIAKHTGMWTVFQSENHNGKMQDILHCINKHECSQQHNEKPYARQALCSYLHRFLISQRTFHLLALQYITKLLLIKVTQWKTLHQRSSVLKFKQISQRTFHLLALQYLFGRKSTKISLPPS